MQFSFWEQESFVGKADIAIIGSGIVGLSTAIHCRARFPDAKILVLERGAIPSGASTRNAGFACFGSLSEIADDFESIGEDKTLQLIEKRWRGLEYLLAKLGADKIGYEKPGNWEVFDTCADANFTTAGKMIPTLNAALRDVIGPDVYAEDPNFTRKNKLPGLECAIKNNYEGQLHTGKMMCRWLDLAAENDIQILNGIQVNDIHENTKEVSLDTSAGIVKTDRLVICTNGFAKSFLPEEDIRTVRNQVFVTTPFEHCPIQGSFHYDKGYQYFRNVGNRILYGGGRNQFGENESTAEFGTTAEVQDFLTAKLSHFIGQSVQIEHSWSGILGVGNSRESLVKQLSDRQFCAVRLGGMGVAVGILVGKEVSILL